MIGKISIRAVSRALHTLHLNDEVARAAINGLPCKRPRQQPIRRLHCGHHGISYSQGRIHIRHVRSKIFRESSIHKNALPDVLLCGSHILVRLELRGLSRPASR